MRNFYVILAVMPLVACASVESRTDARSGVGFDGGDVAPGTNQTGSVEVVMENVDAVPVDMVDAGATDQAAAAKAALASSGGGTTTMTVAGANYSLRQADVNGYSFAIVEPLTKGAGINDDVIDQAEIRTGCLVAPQTYSNKKTTALALDCS